VNSYLTRYRSLLICLVLAAGTLALYEPVIHYEFVDVDDPRFVINNDHVRAGFSWAGLVWATHTVYVETWQPVTWVSHMLDCQLYGLNAGGHHLTSLLIHVANTCLLFVWLNGLTKATWRSAFVAALFAWHPLHVESVAWICERKDVLSTLFWMLALLAYTRYARKPGPGRYALVAVLYALGMMSKPMAVTLPCVLLLVDFWPLNRFGFQLGAAGPIAGRLPAGWPAGAIARSCQSLRLPTWVGNSAVLILEKVPLFLLALGMTAATVYAEGRDYAPLRSPDFNVWRGDSQPAVLKLLPGGRITNGQPLRVSWYHPLLINDSQVTVCMGEPEVYEIFDHEAKLLADHLHPRAVVLGTDEIRMGGTCQACAGCNLAELLGECITKQAAAFRRYSPGARIYVWSDMLDPSHNAHGGYYLAQGDFTGSWEHVPRDVIMTVWGGEPREESLRFFAAHGFSTLAACYYDADNLNGVKQWLTAARPVANVRGFMYTPWARKYELLPAFGELLR